MLNNVINPKCNLGYNIVGYCNLGVMLLKPEHVEQITRESRENENAERNIKDFTPVRLTKDFFSKKH